jgi:hypothetical protein
MTAVAYPGFPSNCYSDPLRKIIWIRPYRAGRDYSRTRGCEDAYFEG